MAKAKHSMMGRITQARMAIKNAQATAEISSRMLKYGYDDVKWREGEDIISEAERAIEGQNTAAGAKVGATAGAGKYRKVAERVYRNLMNMIDGAFDGDNAVKITLGIPSALPRATDEFIAVVQSIFAAIAANPEIAKQLDADGYDAAKLAEEQQKVALYSDVIAEQRRLKTAATRATELQSQAMATLDRWMRKFEKLAKVALEDQPKLLGLLGLSKG